MKIAIIGTGNVGSALAKGFAKSRHEIHVGSRNTERKRHQGLLVESSKKAAEWSEITVLAVPHSAAAEVIGSIGPETLRGKVLLDVSNALGPDMNLAIGFTTSAAEEIAKMAPGAMVVKAFNTVFAQNQSTGRLGSERLTLFVAGDDRGAKEKIMALGEEIGFEPIDAGPLRAARYLEPMGVQLIKLGYENKMGPSIGYRLVRQ